MYVNRVTFCSVLLFFLLLFLFSSPRFLTSLFESDPAGLTLCGRSFIFKVFFSLNVNIVKRPTLLAAAAAETG